jgi:hypothetical protein
MALATPRPALPAPTTRNRCFSRLFNGSPFNRNAEIMPAVATEPVPRRENIELKETSRTLNIVIEAQKFGAISRQDLCSVVITKILKLHQHIRPSLIHSMDELVNEIVILLARY